MDVTLTQLKQEVTTNVKSICKKQHTQTQTVSAAPVVIMTQISHLDYWNFYGSTECLHHACRQPQSSPVQSLDYAKRIACLEFTLTIQGEGWKDNGTPPSPTLPKLSMLHIQIRENIRITVNTILHFSFCQSNCMTHIVEHFADAKHAKEIAHILKGSSFIKFC